ncbi:MAG: hypothetical protein JJE52_10935 [Acidimicrobiia bacterium]|nr:hypothetical protein [Acidimicrobiia bacterium]
MSGASSKGAAMESAPEVSITRGAVPSEEEMVAIVAAVQVTMSSAAVLAAPSPEPSPRWRFSGRWWSKPVASRRERPSVI